MFLRFLNSDDPIVRICAVTTAAIYIEKYGLISLTNEAELREKILSLDTKKDLRYSTAVERF